MSLLKLKALLTNDYLSPEEVTWILENVSDDNIENLDESKLDTLRCIVSHMLMLSEDPATGAYIADRDRARLIIVKIDAVK